MLNASVKPRGTAGVALRCMIGLLLALPLAAPAAARQSAIVVDANSGAVVHEQAADSARFPASLTKVMTLYMLFEQIEAGRFGLNSRLRVSSEAARQPPSKLGVRAGDTIRVEDAILALVTRSANDVAVVVAENIAGSEEDFAERMTRRARQIGMTRTTFRNASGLPNPEQRTTARDMALLGRAIYERFPEQSRYFQRRSFQYGRASIRNHNRLLGRVQHVDGVKTGYTRASGFNLITSARAGGRHLVAVVMGGRTGASRDAQMAQLVRRHFTQMATRRTDYSVARRVRGQAEPVVAARPEPRPTPPAAAEERSTPVRAADARSASPPAEAEGSAAGRAEARAFAERIRPAIVPVPPPPAETDAARREVQITTPPVAASAGPTMQWRTGPRPVASPPQRDAAITTASTAAPAPPAPAAPPREVAAEPAGGWVVQIAATATEADAQRMLREARETVGRRLGNARPVTERVQRGGATLFRARFAGFGDRGAAEAACQALKRNDYACMTIRL